MHKSQGSRYPGFTKKTEAKQSRETPGEFKHRTATLRKTMNTVLNKLNSLCNCIKNFFSTLLCNRKIEKQPNEIYELELFINNENVIPNTWEYDDELDDDSVHAFTLSPSPLASLQSAVFGDPSSYDKVDLENVTNDPLAEENLALTLDSSEIHHDRQFVTKTWFRAISRANHLPINRVKYISSTNSNMKITYEEEDQ